MKLSDVKDIIIREILQIANEVPEEYKNKLMNKIHEEYNKIKRK